MTQLARSQPAGRRHRAPEPVRRLGWPGVVRARLVAVVVLAAVHLTQGTSSVGAGDLLRLAIGQGTDDAAPSWSRPGCRGCWPGSWSASRSVSRAPCCSRWRATRSPRRTRSASTPAPTSRSWPSRAFGLSLPVLPAGGLAFAGGLAAAVLVLALSAGGAAGPTRLILAGSAIALALTR